MDLSIKDLNLEKLDYIMMKPMKTVQKRMNLDDQIEFSFLIGQSIDFELSRKKLDEDLKKHHEKKDDEGGRLLKKKFSRDWD